MLSKKSEKDSYWLAICAGARKLLSIIYYMLKKGFAWNNFKIDNDIRKKLESVITNKLILFENKSKKYLKVLKYLSGQSEELLKEVPDIKDPKQLLITLINSV